ncbi:MAG: hypothetical protein KAQ65_00620 [Candidatus Thorarchaeota archaeon]|nr:hypothetical protein [Candidatus Thorarchaeota archaeon]
MATDFGEGPSPEGKTVSDYSVSATQLVTRTLSLWIKKLPLYLVILGGFLVLLQILEVAIGYYVLGEIWTAGLPSDPTSFITQLVYWFLYPASVSDSFMTLIFLSGIFLVIRLIVLAVVVGSVVKLAMDSYTSDTGDLGSSISSSFNRFIPMILAILIINVLVGVLMAPGTALTSRAMEVLDLVTFAGFEELMTAMVITIAMSVPILFIAVRLAPVYAVISTEDVSVSEAFNRAFNMTSGNFLHIFAGWVLLFILKLVFDIGISIVSDPLILFLGPAIGMTMYNLISLLILTPLDFIFFAVLYMDLESRSRTVSQEYW